MSSVRTNLAKLILARIEINPVKRNYMTSKIFENLLSVM